MFHYYHFHFFMFLYSVVCAFVCSNLAGRKGRSQLLAGFLGFFFGVIAVLGYALVGYKYSRYTGRDRYNRDKRNRNDW